MSAYGRKGRVRKGPPKKKQKVSKIGARLQECIKEITSNSSHKAFFNNLLSQSSARSIKGALAEWDWEDMQVLEKALSCAFCGTRILTFMRIRNRITGATAIIGRDCYDKLVKLNAASDIKIALKSQKRVLRDLDSAFQTRVVQSLRTYHISLGSWKTWFSEMGKRLPRPMWRGLRSLNGLGFLVQAQDIETFIRFHDRYRKYPREALLPEWSQLPFPVPPLLTIARAQQLQQKYRDYQKTLEKAKQRLGRMIRRIQSVITNPTDLADLERHLGWSFHGAVDAGERVPDRINTLKEKFIQAWVSRLSKQRGEHEALKKRLLRARRQIERDLPEDVAEDLKGRIGLDGIEKSNLTTFRAVLHRLNATAPEIKEALAEAPSRRKEAKALETRLRSLRKKIGTACAKKLGQSLGLRNCSLGTIPLSKLLGVKDLLNTHLGALLRMVGCPDSIIASVEEREDRPNETLPDEKDERPGDQSTAPYQRRTPVEPIIRPLGEPVVVHRTSPGMGHSRRRMRSGKSSDRIKIHEGQDGVNDGERGSVANWQHATAEQMDQFCRCSPGALRMLLNRLNLKAGNMRMQGDKGVNQEANLNAGPVEVLKCDWGELKLTRQKTLVKVQVFLARLWNRSELREPLRRVFSSWLKQIRAGSAGPGPHLPPGVRRDVLLLADMWFLPGNANYLELE